MFLNIGAIWKIFGVKHTFGKIGSFIIIFMISHLIMCLFQKRNFGQKIVR